MIFRNIPIKHCLGCYLEIYLLSTILYGLFGVTSKKKKKKKKKGHHVKVYFKFVYALLFTTFALLFEEFYCPPKGFQKFGSYVSTTKMS